MASGPDLFVVCKRGGKPKPPKASRPRLGPLRAGEIPGIRPDRRPYATYALLIVPVVLTIVARAGWDGVIDLILGGPLDGDWWRPVTTQFLYGGTGYEVAALAAVAIFGILLERRHGLWAPLLEFLVGGTLGMLAVVGLDEGSVAVGGNGGALALVGAWAMRDVLGRRRGIEDDSDLLGVLAVATLLVLLPLATEDAHALAGLGGGLAGVLMGLGLARLPER